VKEILVDGAAFIALNVAWYAFWNWVIKTLWQAYGEWFVEFVEFPD
jgi:hypothetical protein